MSRARDKSEQELLRGMRRARSEAATSRVCSGSECAQYGVAQPLENFYGRLAKDCYCKPCRAAVSAQWRMDHPDYVRKPSAPRTDWDLTVSKAPKCEDHHVPTTECGCAVEAQFHKSPAHRAKIAESVRAAWAIRKKLTS